MYFLESAISINFLRMTTVKALQFHRRAQYGNHLVNSMFSVCQILKIASFFQLKESVGVPDDVK